MDSQVNPVTQPTNGRIDAIEKDYTRLAKANRDRIKKVLDWTRAMLALAVLMFLFGGVFTIIELQANSKLAHKVQHQRTASILTTCNEGNQRHDSTISELWRLAQQNPGTTPAQRAMVERSIKSTILLVNDLQPKYNCRIRVRQLNK